MSWLGELKRKIRSAQVKAALAASRELILFYWELGASISQQLAVTDWGGKVIDQPAKDLSSEFPDIQGFSRRNLYYTKTFYEVFSGFPDGTVIVTPTGAQLKMGPQSEDESRIVPRSGAQMIPEIVHQIGGQFIWSSNQ